MRRKQHKRNERKEMRHRNVHWRKIKTNEKYYRQTQCHLHTEAPVCVFYMFMHILTAILNIEYKSIHVYMYISKWFTSKGPVCQRFLQINGRAFDASTPRRFSQIDFASILFITPLRVVSSFIHIWWDVVVKAKQSDFTLFAPSIYFSFLICLFLNA